VTAALLRLKADPGLGLDMSNALPEQLAGLDERSLAARPLQLGNRRVPMGELFDVCPGDTTEVVVEGSSRRLERLGAGMTVGGLTIEGDAGACLGVEMRGGTIEVHGSAGDLAGAAMRDGLIRISGSAGHFMAASLPGDMHGMAGGAILVGGSAGDRLGDRMRRGVIAVAGGCGDFLASRLIGGTILLGGERCAWPGYGMRRGSLVFLDPKASLPHLFTDGGAHDLTWLTLLDRHLASLGWQGPRPPGRARRLTGDVSVGGKGEILLAA
jgi:formylmethanofuran dehydrogenase subunit C